MGTGSINDYTLQTYRCIYKQLLIIQTFFVFSIISGNFNLQLNLISDAISGNST